MNPVTTSTSTRKGEQRGKSARGVDAINLVPVKNGDKVVGFTFDGFLPFDAFTDEKEGNEFTIYRDAEGKTVRNPTLEEIQEQGLIADEQKATPHRDLQKRFTNAEIIWPDDKIRTIAVKLKANAPMTPDEFEAQKAERQTSRAAASVSKMTPEQLRAVQAQIAARLAEAEGEEEAEG